MVLVLGDIFFFLSNLSWNWQSDVEINRFNLITFASSLGQLIACFNLGKLPMFFSFKEGFQYTVALSLYFIPVFWHLCFISKSLFGKVLESGVKPYSTSTATSSQYVVRMMMAGTGPHCLPSEACLCAWTELHRKKRESSTHCPLESSPATRLSRKKKCYTPAPHSLLQKTFKSDNWNSNSMWWIEFNWTLLLDWTPENDFGSSMSCFWILLWYWDLGCSA